MNVEVKKLPRGQAELIIEIPADEYEPFLKRAAFFISEKMTFDGFRPGKAPYDVVKNKVGEARLWEEALEPAVKKTLPKALDENKVAAVGSPNISVEKLAPGNPVVYKATISILPEVKLADIKSISVEKKEVSARDEDVEKSLKHLQKMRAKEALVDRPIKEGDKAVINFTQYLDNVVIEGGEQKSFPVTVGENTFIPEFEKNLVGMKKGDKKEFQITYPKEFHQKNLAGKAIDFKVEVIDVFEVQMPKLDDDFAKSLGGFSSADDLRAKIKENLLTEAKQKEQHRQEDEIIKNIAEKSTIGDIPDVLINSESKKMLAELEQNVASQGMKFDDYLSHLKKTRADLLLDFSKGAVDRIKGALISREVAKQHNIKADDGEVNAEIEKILAHNNDPEIEKQVKGDDYRNYLVNVLTARKVMEFLKKETVQ